jgi:hypothetical protein
MHIYKIINVEIYKVTFDNLVSSKIKNIKRKDITNDFDS